MDLEKVKQLIELLEEKGLSEIFIRDGDQVIRIVKHDYSVIPAANFPIAAPSTQAKSIESQKPSTTEQGQEVATGLHEIKSPIVGTFYRRPSPEQPPYVEVGDIVEPGQVLCIVEAMKVMNEITSDIRGRIVEILVEDAHPVEYGQVLFRIEPQPVSR